MARTRHRRTHESAPPPGKAAGGTLPPADGLKLALAGLGLATYAALFYFAPLSVAPTGWQGSFARWRLALALAVPDELWQSWTRDASWQAVQQRALIAALATAIFLVAWAAGWLALRLARLDRRLTRLERFVFAAGIGLNLVSLATLAAGLAGLLRLGLFVAAGAVVVAVAGFVRWRDAGRSDAVGIGVPVAAVERDALVVDRRCLWLSAPLVAAIALGAMLPAIDFDVREYHLQAPKEFYQAGRIGFVPHNVYANMPLGAEMLSLAGMVAAGDWWLGGLVGKLLIAAYAPLAALGLLAAGSRFFTPSAGRIAALVYLATPWIALVSMQSLIDGAFAFYLLMALYAALLWQRATNEDPLRSALAGVGWVSGRRRGVLQVSGGRLLRVAAGNLDRLASGRRGPRSDDACDDGPDATRLVGVGQTSRSLLAILRVELWRLVCQKRGALGQSDLSPALPRFRRSHAHRRQRPAMDRRAPPAEYRSPRLGRAACRDRAGE